MKQKIGNKVKYKPLKCPNCNGEAVIKDNGRSFCIECGKKWVLKCEAKIEGA